MNETEKENEVSFEDEINKTSLERDCFFNQEISAAKRRNKDDEDDGYDDEDDDFSDEDDYYKNEEDTDDDLFDKEPEEDVLDDLEIDEIDEDDLFDDDEETPYN